MIGFLKNRKAYPDELEAWQVSKILNCSIQHVYQILRKKLLLHYRVGKKYYIVTDDLVRFLEERKVDARK